MPTPTPTRREEYAALTRRALLDAAAELFLSQGFGDTSMVEIAAHARVSKGAIYHHFADKAALFRALIVDACTEHSALIREKVQQTSHLPAPERAQAALETALDTMVDDQLYRTLRAESISVLGPAARREIDEEFSLPLIRGIFQTYAARGELRADVSVQAATVCMAALFDTAANEIALSQSPAGARREYTTTLLQFAQSLLRD